MVCLDIWLRYNLKIWACQKTKYCLEKISFKVQMKSLAMHITNQKFNFNTFMVGNLLHIFIEHDFYLIS